MHEQLFDTPEWQKESKVNGFTEGKFRIGNCERCRIEHY